MQRIFKLNIQVLGEALLLLVLTLGITAYFSRKELQEESVRVAEQTLEGTMRDIDNILLSVEQSTGNIYYDLIQHLDNPEMMYEYSRELVKCNPNIVGCAIAFKPGFYPDKDLFMAYVRLKEASKDANSDLVTSEKFTKRPYTEQTWFTEPVNTGRSGWIDPLKGSDTESEPLMTFCLPISDKNEQRVGVLAVDISVKQLSNDIQKAKPSENGYCVLLAHNGSYIVHPSIKKLQDGTTFSHFKKDVDPSEVEAAKAMIAGKKGMKEFRRDNSDWCVFYKPFERAKWEGRLEENTGWSIGVVYPEDDIFGAYNKLLWLVLAIAVAGLTLFFLLSSWIIRKQLKPLKKLVYTAKQITEGNYSELVPATDRQDEIGQLQHLFRKMQLSLQKRVTALEERRERLDQQGIMLRAAYDKTLEVDGLKTSFLHYMTKQMSGPTEQIDHCVTTLCNNYNAIEQKELEKQVETIARKGQTLLELLNHMTHFTKADYQTK